MKENVQLENSDTNSDSISDHKEVRITVLILLYCGHLFILCKIICSQKLTSF